MTTMTTMPDPDDHPLLAAAIAALRGLPLDALADYILFQSDFARWPARRRACFILAANPSFSNARVAALVGGTPLHPLCLAGIPAAAADVAAGAHPAQGPRRWR